MEVISSQIKSEEIVACRQLLSRRPPLSLVASAHAAGSFSYFTVPRVIASTTEKPASPTIGIKKTACARRAALAAMRKVSGRAAPSCRPRHLLKVSALTREGSQRTHVRRAPLLE
jgi:hypothetical protein